MEIGEYVRTKDGKIGIFDKYSSRPDSSIYKCPANCFVKLQGRKTPLQCWRDYIVKHSKNIKELVEEKDILTYRVNNFSIIKIGEVKKYKEARTFKEYLGVEGFSLEQIKVLSISTKERFRESEYIVE